MKRWATGVVTMSSSGKPRQERPLDVTPASIGMKTTMILRFINEQGHELDRVVFSRIAGA